MQCNFSLWEFPCVSDSKDTPQAILAIVKSLMKRDGTNCHLWLFRTKDSSAWRNQHNSQLLRKPVHISPPVWQKPWVEWRLRVQALFKTLDSHPPRKNKTLWLTKLTNLLNYEDCGIDNIENTCLRHPTRPLIHQCIQLTPAYFPTPRKGAKVLTLPRTSEDTFSKFTST